MKILLAHDYLTQRGGAERVALQLTQAFSEAPLYTSVYNPQQTFDEFSNVDVRTTWLQRLPVARRDPRLVLPLIPPAWDSVPGEDYEVIIASSTGFAHGVKSSTDARKIVYCHNPPRWLYQPDDYIKSRTYKMVMAALRPRLLAWDQAAARSVDTYIANSTSVAERITRHYGVSARVVHPPVSVDPTGPQEQIAGIAPGYWLTIARGRGYKNTDIVVNAISRMPGAQLVVVGAPPGAFSHPAIKEVGFTTDEQLRWLYANAQALVSVSFEDFGLTPIEANAFGTPVAVLRAGGFLDSTIDGVSGTFIEEPTWESVKATLESFPTFEAEGVKTNANRFSPEAFRTTMRRIAFDPDKRDGD